MQIVVEKYPTPIQPRGFDFMAYDEDFETDRSIYGFGSTEQEAIADFKRQLEDDVAARRREFRDSKDGKPFYCKLCGLGFQEMMACEESDCELETEDDAMKRFEPA